MCGDGLQKSRLTKKSRLIKRHVFAGQNLVELVLVLPFLLILIFAVVEIGRCWQAYEGAKMAAMDGAYTASINQSASKGLAQLSKRVDQSKLTATQKKVEAMANTQGGVVGYKASITVEFKPILGNLSIPTLSGTKPLFPATFPIKYEGIAYNSVY